MGRKHVIKSFKMFDLSDISTNQTSNVTNVLQLDKASIFVEWTGTAPEGVINVQAKQGDDGTWASLDFGSATGTDIPITGNTGAHRILLNELPFTEIRIQYVSTSGTGTMTATITSKTVGA